jgi:pilus assembly protein CpaE
MVGYVERALGGEARVLSLAALFPQAQFVSVGASWPDEIDARLAVAIVSADASQLGDAERRLAADRSKAPVIVVLANADVTGSRRLMRAGAADVLPAPVSEAALTLSLERVLARPEVAQRRGPDGQVIGVIKAGGGVGATSLIAQMAIQLAGRGAIPRGVCVADLDLQFGLAANYLDIDDAIAVTDLLAGGTLSEAPLGEALATHPSGARLLAAPRELTPLEVLHPQDVQALVTAFRREFGLTLIDLPPAWTAWTYKALQLCDRIVLVTSLTVPHINLVQLQLKVIAAQGLEGIPLTLVCNQVGPDETAILSVKAAERALKRSFDAVLPSEPRLMNDATSQGRELSAIRRGTRLEQAIGQLAAALVESSRVEGATKGARR